ncbi:coiled-coil domain-containing protein 113 [Musca vetustissima]|uniref:coiled-coil domain-containing protein 113 n=1 Tax=Musca vetustissima TaxID=27455 RepID=UPI002AB72322|nr:coiled-coil domain-containing protein 113 [Musca vetustissima]
MTLFSSSQNSSRTETIFRHAASSGGAGGSNTNPSSLSRGGRAALAALSQQEEANLALETFINSLQLPMFFQLAEGEQDERLAKLDALELYQALQDVNRDLAMARLENLYLSDFLEKNDPKLLIGLQQRRATAHNASSRGRKPELGSTQSVSSSLGTRTRASMSRSHVTTTTGSSQKKTAYDYRLNFRAKADMAEKTANDVEKRVKEIESKASREIKVLRGHMEEMRFMYEETLETITNFQLHFMRDGQDLEFLNSATEKQLERKLRKFVNNWIKNARALLATMRLKITSLQDSCQHVRAELLTKSDLSGILTAIDFEKLMIKRSELLSSLDEKNMHMSGLKAVTGKASLAMTEAKQIMMSIEMESGQLHQKTVEVIKAIGKLEKEAGIVEKENQKDMEALENLRQQLERYEAPSVRQYIEKKNELMALEKEEKMLQRKIYILNMKLENTEKKYKSGGGRKEEGIFINI